MDVEIIHGKKEINMPTPATLQGIAASIDALLEKQGITAPRSDAITMTEATAILQAGPKIDGSDYASSIGVVGTGLVLHMARVTMFGIETWTVPIRS